MQYQNMLAIEILRDVFFHILVYAVAGWIASSGHIPEGQASDLTHSRYMGEERL